MSTTLPQTALDWWHIKEAEAVTIKAHSDPSKTDSSNARFLARIAYQRLGTWDAVAQWYGEHSKSAYHRLATDEHFYPSREFIALVEAHDLPPIRCTIAIPDKHDAAVYLTPDGHGDLSTSTVPEDCTVAILPPGARIVAASEAKPKRQRGDDWDVRFPGHMRGKITPARIRQLVAADIAAQENQSCLNLGSANDGTAPSMSARKKNE